MFFCLNIVCIWFNLLAPRKFLLPSQDHFEGPERSPSTWSQTAHPRDMSSSHLMFVKLVGGGWLPEFHFIFHGNSLENYEG